VGQPQNGNSAGKVGASPQRSLRLFEDQTPAARLALGRITLLPVVPIAHADRQHHSLAIVRAMGDQLVRGGQRRLWVEQPFSAALRAHLHPVILSGGNRFACESISAVEGPRVSVPLVC